MYKISAKEYYEFRTNFFSPHTEEGLRLGQAFLNKFFPDLVYPELYYQLDILKADMLIHCEFLTYD